MYVSIFSTLLLLQDSWQGKRFIKSQLCNRYKLIKLGSTAEWLACIADLVKPNSKGKNEDLFPSPWPPPPCNNGLLFISQYLQETANSPNLNEGGRSVDCFVFWSYPMKGQCLNNFAIDCSFSFAALFSCLCYANPLHVGHLIILMAYIAENQRAFQYIGTLG